VEISSFRVGDLPGASAGYDIKTVRMLRRMAIRAALGLAFITLVPQLGSRPQEKSPTATQIDPPQPTDRFMGKWKLNLDKSWHTGMVSDRIKLEYQEGYVRFTRDSLNGNAFKDHYTFTTDMRGGLSKEAEQNGRTLTTGWPRVIRLDSSRFREESPLAIDEYRVNSNGRKNVQWRRDCAAKVGLGFTLPTGEEQPLMDKSGQVLKEEVQEELRPKSI
jgi:hypothetical protein